MHSTITIKDRFYVTIGSALGLGLSPIAPGTFGTLLGVFIHAAVVVFVPENLQLGFLLAALLLVCAGNHLLTPWAVRYWQSEDPRHFVLDEVAGYLLVPILYRPGEFWYTALWGFVLFRVFDIIKLPPAKHFDENVPGAWGILLDDLVSAVYAVAVLYGIDWLNP